MGFSTIGAGVVLIVGALFIGTMLLNATFDAQRDVMRGLDEERDLRALERATAASVKDAEHRPNGILHVNVTNTGGSALDASRTVVLLDGAWSNHLILSHSVDGRNTDVWAPTETLHLRLDSASPPGRVFVVLETGLGLSWAPA